MIYNYAKWWFRNSYPIVFENVGTGHMGLDFLRKETGKFVIIDSMWEFKIFLWQQISKIRIFHILFLMSILLNVSIIMI